MARGPAYLFVTGTHLNVGASEETTLSLADKSEVFVLVGFHYVRSGGSAATYTPRLGQIAGWTDADIRERMTYGSTAVATPTNEVFLSPIPCKTDASGNLYFRPGFNTGADNDGNFEFIFAKGL